MYGECNATSNVYPTAWLDEVVPVRRGAKRELVPMASTPLTQSRDGPWFASTI